MEQLNVTPTAPQSDGTHDKKVGLRAAQGCLCSPQARGETVVFGIRVRSYDL